jgi:triacylglycerol lipase
MQKYLKSPILLCVIITFSVILNVKPCYLRAKISNKRLELCREGYSLLIIFLISMVLIIVQDVYCYINGLMTQDVKVLIIHFISLFLTELILFWNGMIRIYISSIQLGIKWRVLGAVFAFFPIVNLVILMNIISIVRKEVNFENAKILLNRERKDEMICKTKYPILLVHGVFFRDYKYYNYWGRIPYELQENGAAIFLGNHQSAASVKDSAKELKQRIEDIIRENNCEKVNIIYVENGYNITIHYNFI